MLKVELLIGMIGSGKSRYALSRANEGAIIRSLKKPNESCADKTDEDVPFRVGLFTVNTKTKER